MHTLDGWQTFCGIVLATGALSCLSPAAGAQTLHTYEIDFSFSDFIGRTRVPAPQDPVTGSVTVTSPSNGGYVYAITGVDLAIVGQPFAVSQVEFLNRHNPQQPPHNTTLIGGLNDTSSFQFQMIDGPPGWSLNPLSYSLVSRPNLTWTSTHVTYDVKLVPGLSSVVTAIPEPGSVALMLSGLGGVLWVARRRRADIPSQRLARRERRQPIGEGVGARKGCNPRQCSISS